MTIQDKLRDMNGLTGKIMRSKYGDLYVLVDKESEIEKVETLLNKFSTCKGKQFGNVIYEHGAIGILCAHIDLDFLLSK
jgi:hypothetical protein